MAQKNATPSRAHGAIIRKNGLSTLLWTVIHEKRHFLIVRHRVTGIVKAIPK